MKDNYLFPELLNKYIDRWNKTPAEITVHTKKNYTKENDRNLILLKKTFLKWLKDGNQLSELKDAGNQRVIKEKVIDFMVHTLGIEKWVCEILDNEGYYEVTHKFIELSKDTIDGISFDDIFQALRNIWVIVALQIYMGEEVRLTDAMFAYSMLYPLTDNYLDNPNIPLEEKSAFNDRFYKKIHSSINEPANEDESRIFHMIDLIASDFPRDRFPDVFKGLLTILDGQKKSLEQHRSNDLSDTTLLHYTLYKGGASVLADAFLVRGSLSENEADFAYGYGIILQLADDLQDIRSDSINGHCTPYNRKARTGPLDDLFQKHENFTMHFMNHTFQTKTEKQKAIHQLIDRSLELLLFGGVCDNKKLFSGRFLKQYRRKSLFSFKAFRRLNKRINKKIIL